jgi:hypothetical protein
MRTLPLLATVLLAGCPDRHVSELPETPATVITKDIPVEADLDLLFVIDNSASTGDKQDLFRQNFTRFVNALSSFPGGRPNLHIAVVTTSVDIGAQGWGGCPSPDPKYDGRFQTGSMCGVNGQYIVDVATPGTGTRQINYAGALDTTFSCMAAVGSGGCGFEAPLEAMKRALDGTYSQNAGFLWPSALLAVVILTDEDDASVRDPALFGLPGTMDDFRAQPLYAYGCDQPISASGPGTYKDCHARTDSYLADPESYVQFLATIKDPAQTVIAVIASPPPGFDTNDSPAQRANVNTDAIVVGPVTLNGHTQNLALEPSTTCTINNTAAIGRPAVRLESFLSNYSPAYGRFYNVCQPDYSAALADISQTLSIDIDPCLPGDVLVPLDCDVIDVQNKGTSAETSHALPQCGAGVASPCWSATQDATTCPAPTSGYKLNVSRDQPPPDGTVVEVQCAVGVQ